MEILEDDLQSADVVALLREHVDSLAAMTPAESTHTLDIDGLKVPTISFYVVRENGELLGCGALKEIDAAHGEVKSMRTAPRHTHKGVGSRVLRHLIDTASARGYERLSLETGTRDKYAAAHALYLKFNFEYCGPFADYREDPAHSDFMTLLLNQV